MSTKTEISEEIHPKTIITATLQDKFTPFTPSSTGPELMRGGDSHD